MVIEGIVFSEEGCGYAKPTVALRFLRGRLQQGWEITENVQGTMVMRQEWRDVPEATIDEE